jgi:Histidine kinase-, DNA gyrase B-, and HSP90-like ATPase
VTGAAGAPGTAAADALVLKFGGSLVEQLGAQLYPSVTATVAELVSNAWDAEARNVWIEMPFGTWEPDSEIVVTDDGLGMTRDEAQNAYLVVGRKRRLEGHHEMSANGLRRVHGRKGIGKLAAFGTAGILECSTLKDGQHTAFRLDYDAIRKLAPTADYTVETAADGTPPASPQTGAPLEHGTRIKLTSLLQKRSLGHEQFVRSMARRFAISTDEMAVHINGTALTRFEMDVQFRFPGDATPDGVTVLDGWAVEAIDEKHVVKWWIGFTAKPLDDENLQGISVLANRKMAQRPFMFDRSQGTEGQLGQEYLIGEVQADWIDEGTDVEDDLIQSNRDQLQLEDDRLTPFIEWGRRRLAWALRERNHLRQREAVDKFEASAELIELFKPFTRVERTQFTKIAVNASKLPEMDANGLVGLMRSVVDANSDAAVRGMIEEIEASDENVQPRMWQLVRQFGLIDARRVLTIIEARIETIRRLRDALATGAKEIPELHETVRKDPWLLDPRWHLLDDEVDMTRLGIEFQPETDDETGARLDFMFGLLPHPPALVDEVIIVEIKRGTYTNGRVRSASETEVDKFSHYVSAAQEFQQRANSRAPRVRGLMIAQAYTSNGDRQRKLLEKVGDPQMEFKTWDRVIDETERMHLGWLEVSRLRSREPDDATAPAAVAVEPPAPVPETAVGTVAASGGSGPSGRGEGVLDPGGDEIDAGA